MRVYMHNLHDLIDRVHAILMSMFGYVVVGDVMMEIEVPNQAGNKSKDFLFPCVGLIVVLAIASITLFMDNRNLQAEIARSQAEIEGLEFEARWLDDAYESYVASHEYSNQQYEQAKFHFYYIASSEQEFGVSDLEDEIQGRKWLRSYQEGVFDCSEMSAYLEWYLENEGWNVDIVIGVSPFGSGRHAWLLVETSEGKYMPVEATSISVVLWDDPNFDNYWEYDQLFEDIHDAIAYNESEFDWWQL